MSTRSRRGAVTLISIILALTVFGCGDGATKPPDVERSRLYTVSLASDNGASPVAVYEVRNPGSLPGGNVGPSKPPTTEQSTSWASFPVTVPLTITVTSNTPFTSARVLPTHAGIIASSSGNTVTFQVSKPGQLAVSFCRTGATCNDANDTDFANPLLLFANPPEIDAPNPRAADVQVAAPGASVPALKPGKNILYFGPGTYDLGTTSFPLSSNQSIYLADGAYVRGAFLGDTIKNIHIFGRGILSGEAFPRTPGSAVPRLADSVKVGTPPLIYVNGGHSQNILVEGITLVQAPFYNIELNGTGNRVNNIKAISWYSSTDGVQVSYDNTHNGIEVAGAGIIEDSFFKVGDDAIKLFSSNLVVRRCTIWQMQNAAAFEIGDNVNLDLSNILVENSDVIRTEHNFPNRNNAVFAANHGGAGNLHHYLFDDIRVENASWQLIQMALQPNMWISASGTGSKFGSLDDIVFRNISVTSPQALPNLIEGYDRQHTIGGITFDNVTVGGQTLPAPSVTLSANRAASFSGEFSSSPVWRNIKDPTHFQIWLTSLPIVPKAPYASSPTYSPVDLVRPLLTGDYQFEGSGDFYGDGLASILFYNRVNHELGIWKDPLQTHNLPWNRQYAAITALDPSDGNVVGIGDFNGDGYCDVLLWNSASEQGTALLMNGDQLIGKLPLKPSFVSDWTVAGIGDFDQNGVSDIVLRDSNGFLEILYGKGSGLFEGEDFGTGGLHYGTTPYYNTLWPAERGTFDSNWLIDGVLDVEGSGYANILWQNAATGAVAFSRFSAQRPQTQWGTVFARIPAGSRIDGIGDYNGDGGLDLLLRNVSSGQTTVWFLNWFNGNYFVPGPTFTPGLETDWEVQGSSSFPLIN